MSTAAKRDTAVFAQTPFDPLCIRAPKVRRFHGLWRSLRQDGTIPRPEDIDPVQFEYALGTVSLIDVVRRVDRYRFYLRLVGTEVASRHGKDFTGSYVDEIVEEPTKSLLTSTYMTVVNTAEPAWRLRDGTVGGHAFTYEALVCPLGRDGIVTRLISIIAWPEDYQPAPWPSP